MGLVTKDDGWRISDTLWKRIEQHQQKILFRTDIAAKINLYFAVRCIIKGGFNRIPENSIVGELNSPL